MPKSKFILHSSLRFFILISFTWMLANCSPKSKREDGIHLEVTNGKTIVFGNGQLKLEFNSRLGCRIYYSDKHLLLNEVTDTTPPPHYVISNKAAVTDFALNYDDVVINDITNEFGKGKELILKGINQDAGLEKTLVATLYYNYPNAVIWHAAYTNVSNHPVQISESVSNSFLLDASLTDKDLKNHEMWTYQGIAYDWGLDYVFPLKIGFSRENFTGIQPKSKMGGGVPMIDYWNRKMGLAIAHIEKKPMLLSLPVQVRSNGKTEISIKNIVNQSLSSGKTYRSIKTVVIAHNLDFFNPLNVYSSLMKDQGLSMKEPSPETYEPIWCGWGYESDFTLKDIYATLPKIKKLGIKWVVIDDRWFDRYGDWNPRKELFPGGEKQLKGFVDSLHKQGFLVKIWWVPTLAQPSTPPPDGNWPSATPGSSDLVKNHPEWLVVDEKGNHPRCPRNMYFLNASLPAVQDHIRKLTRKFIEDWGFDGSKLDAYWVVPPSYDTATPHPELSYQAVPDLIKIIYETSKSIKPYSVTEICNCGTPQDFYQSLYIDQPVVADPTTFTQVRFRVKAFKALWGGHSPIYTDHVEHISTYTDHVVHEIGEDEMGTDDFASAVGTGGVPGTKFTWPNGYSKVQLTPEKEIHWKKWLSLYRDKMLSKGEYLNLYDLAYDKPEGHAIKKDGKMYYAFYNKDWNGKIELRGLQNNVYQIKDYVNDKIIGQVKGPLTKINYSFKEYLLLECTPVSNAR